MKSKYPGVSKYLLSLVIANLATIYAGEPSALDYKDPANWISNPSENIEHTVDVFYIYPTVYFGDTPDWMDLGDPELCKKAQGVVKEHCGIFKGEANIFAPYYQQVSLPVLMLPQAEQDRYIDLAYRDAENAFLHYLNTKNEGRAFIMAGHSQGSMMILKLLEDHFDEPELMNKLVVAYLIGYSVTDEDLAKHPWLKISMKSNDLGTIVTYNTQSPDAVGSPVLLPGARCVNPLSWTVDDTPAPANLNVGAVFFDENNEVSKVIPGYTDAKIAKTGALIASVPNPDDFYTPGVSAFPRGVYHLYDYSFFYQNLKQNIQVRIKACLNGSKP